MSRVEEENKRLKDTLAQLEQGAKPQRVDEARGTQQRTVPISQSQQGMVVYTPDSSAGLGRRERMVIRDANDPFSNPQSSGQLDTVAQSHGPTSAVADEIASNLGMMARKPHQHAEGSETARNALFANSARSSQLEKIHFGSGRYDFDGVEPRLAMRLLSLFWDRQLDVGAVVYRPLFMRDMACNGPYFSKLLLNAIYFTASKHCSHAEVFDDRNNALTAGRRFRRRIMEFIGDHITTSEIPTVQALLLLSYALFNWCDEKSLSWLYSGMAFNMITDLGIHSSHAVDSRFGKLALEDIEARQRLFWGAYTVISAIDKFLSLYQGRCIRLRDADASIFLQFLDEHEEFEALDPSSYASSSETSNIPSHGISILKGYCSLSIIMSGILETLYTERSTTKDPSTLLDAASSLYNGLQGWLVALPSILSTPLSRMSSESASPHILSLRPFVSDGHLRSVSLSIAPVAFATCVSAAASIDHIHVLYGRSFSMRSAPYILSYATYVSATIHARVAAQSAPGSSAHASLRRCILTLRAQKQASLGPKKALEVIESLIRRVGIHIDDDCIASSSTDATTQRSESTLGADNRNTDTSANTAESITDPFQISTTSDEHLIPEGIFEYDMDCIFQSFNIPQDNIMQQMRHSPLINNEDAIWDSSTTSMLDPMSPLFPLDPLYGLENIPSNL
ncbi:fungal-specific transcription factor domain-containing protein [Penicillium angulare]|uniref:fungal-specific transcription factor domain-containing protein n=1 Tax=Penicillium angulare TaxID=116970 RepID=UPI00253FA9C5|nr:fungal-specific transcription factor domain-containing protein [Penicillium angulare]KAJ5261349.1 fungal-specific transcription factor domain-containing protein [Penicillium angulare]